MKNAKKRNKKILLTLLLLLCMLSVVTGSLYGYWAAGLGNPQEKAASETVTIGKAKTLDTTIIVNDPANPTKKLVPAGKTAISVGGDTDNIETYSYTFDVNWVEGTTSVTSADAISGTLSVQATPIIQGADSANNTLVKVSISPASSTIICNNATANAVTVTVTLDEPGTKAVYDNIINKPIAIGLKFNITQ